MKDPYTIYCVALAACGVISLFVALWFFKLNEKNLSLREKLPRNAFFGVLTAVAAALWCIPHAVPVVPAGLQHLIVPGAVVAAVLAITFLDYLFARTLGGFLILLAHYLLHDSFTFHTPLSPIFAVFCFIIGTAGIFFAGKPYLMRDLIRKGAKERIFRFAVSAFFVLFAISCIAASIFHFAGVSA
ncbi:MAG: hypothetical protein A2020_05485 [Lentisphaerae bacterium GWF2_45_14]|nr:MAG: hypothetical protein A2020_05485 [Lentisphaerae bacterium GWF2_45_14]